MEICRLLSNNITFRRPKTNSNVAHAVQRWLTKKRNEVKVKVKVSHFEVVESPRENPLHGIVATRHRRQWNGGCRLWRKTVGTSAWHTVVSPGAAGCRASARARPEVGGGRIAHRALVQLLDESLFRPQFVVEVARQGRGSSRRHHRRSGRPARKGAAAAAGGRRKGQFLFDGEPGQIPAAVEIVPLAGGADSLQVDVVGIAAQRRQDLFDDRLVPLQGPVLAPDRVQVVDPVELELRLDAVRYFGQPYLRYKGIFLQFSVTV